MMGILKKVMIGMIRFYRNYLSMLKSGPTCKYYPTCSQYAIEAIEKAGYKVKFQLLPDVSIGYWSDFKSKFGF